MLSKGGKPFGIILFADKSRLSTFGTQKGYPVIARIANLDSNLRSGIGPGGGRVVGFLPIVCLIKLSLLFVTYYLIRFLNRLKDIISLDLQISKILSGTSLLLQFWKVLRSFPSLVFMSSVAMKLSVGSFPLL